MPPSLPPCLPYLHQRPRLSQSLCWRSAMITPLIRLRSLHHQTATSTSLHRWRLFSRPPGLRLHFPLRLQQARRHNRWGGFLLPSRANCAGTLIASGSAVSAPRLSSRRCEIRIARVALILTAWMISWKISWAPETCPAMSTIDYYRHLRLYHRPKGGCTDRYEPLTSLGIAIAR
ncbi:hypothetical protein F5Y15DRAFT_366637 [Xylariaceae sp. FL0016]|nr:hypothetical protein F5Y15DRAFT_366637 [Xylariaceae sp. FL0016]